MNVWCVKCLVFQPRADEDQHQKKKFKLITVDYMFAESRVRE